MNALKFAHEDIKKIIALQEEIVKEVNPQKRDIPDDAANDDLNAAIDKSISNKIDDIIQLADKSERESATSQLHQDTLESLEEKFPENEKEVKKIESIKYSFVHFDFIQDLVCFI